MCCNSPINTLYGPIEKNILEMAYHIRLLICDIDGVISNGLIYLNKNEEQHTFHTKDKYGMQCLIQSGIKIAIITYQRYQYTEQYFQKLGIEDVYQGIFNKVLILQKLIHKMKLTKNKIACISMDCTDIALINEVGFSIAVANAHPLLKDKTNYVTHIAGGEGAIREICDLLLLAQGKLTIVNNYYV